MSTGPDAIAIEFQVPDVLVFERSEHGYRLLGGAGRGAGWAGIVDLRPEDELLVERAWRTSVPIRVCGAVPSHVAGPYWANHAVIVPVGHEHIVILGGETAIEGADATFVRAAARAVAGTHGLAAEKLLADELELVHAIRALMAYRPETVLETLRHIVAVTAQALSCEVGVARIDHDGVTSIAMVEADGTGSESAGPDAATFLAAAASAAGPIVEQAVASEPRVFVRDVASRLTLPLGHETPLGALVLGHAADRPRGFTELCQRIGRALAEAAELLLTQAIARERLAEERDLLHRLNRTDPLTGLGNRTAWDEAVAAYAASGRDPRGAVVISADLDRLKEVNDALGHPVGDALIRAAGNLIRAGLREEDVVVRIGGDEFLVLLRDTDAAGAERIARRIARARRIWRVTEHALPANLSIGWAVVHGTDVAGAVRVADARMYAVKRRRRRATNTYSERRSAT